MNTHIISICVFLPHKYTKLMKFFFNIGDWTTDLMLDVYFSPK
jgi:hypothetical protein